MRLHLEKRVTAEIQQASFLMMYKPEYLYTKIYTSTQSKWEDTVINKEHIHSQKDQYRVYFSYLQNLLSWLTQNGYWNCFPDKIADVYQLSLCACAPSQLETSGKKRLLQNNIESIEYPYVVICLRKLIHWKHIRCHLILCRGMQMPVSFYNRMWKIHCAYFWTHTGNW